MATNYNDYSKTTWTDSSAPALNATNLNKIEQGIYDNREDVQDLDARDSYSTDEQVIGTWITGETLYRKVFRLTSGLPAVNTQGTLDVSSCNIKQCTSCKGWEKTSQYNHIGMDYWYSTGSYNRIYCNGTQVFYYYGWLPTEVYIIIEYTKTTT